MISYPLYFTLWIGTSALAWAFGSNGYIPIAWGLVILGLIWTLSIVRRWMWIGNAACLLVGC